MARPEIGLAAIIAAGSEAHADGAAGYRANCASCHAEDLSGSVGPALRGPGFDRRWQGRETALQRLIAATMPLSAPGSLPAAQYSAITFYLLAAAGNTRGVGLPASTVSTDRPALPGPPRSFGVARSSGPDDAELMQPSGADWPRYNGDYRSQRVSPLDQITPRNVATLVPKCIFQTGEVGSFQASPIIRAGRLYITTAHNTYALDAATCRELWVSAYTAPDNAALPTNRGAALYRGMVIRGTLDCHLIALDAVDGSMLWDVPVCDDRNGAFISAAPVVFDGKLFVGEAGGDIGNSGHIHAFDASTGRHLWTFDTVPAQGQPGSETWQAGARPAGGASWSTITVDPATRRLYVPVGNPNPDTDGNVRPGANLYTESVVVLDADTGRLAWYVQQVPHDVHDWDTAAAPAIYDQDGRTFMAVGSKSGFLYIYDRNSHSLIAREGLGRRLNDTRPLSHAFLHQCPGVYGGVEWNGPAYDPTTRLVFVNAVDWCGKLKSHDTRVDKSPGYGDLEMDPVSDARGSLRAFDAATGAQRWAYQAVGPMLAAITSTRSGLVFTGSAEGDMLAFDAATGAKLYSFYTGGAIAGGVSTYMVAGQQYVAVASGNMSKSIWHNSGAATVVIFGLPQQQH